MSSIPLAPPRTTPARALLDRQAARESSARTYARSLPIVPVRARGASVEGADGRRYLDCLSGAGALALGHNHPAVVEAIRAMLDRQAPLQVLDMATPERDAFVEELFATLPEPLASTGRVHFCSPAGTDAVEAAWKLVQAATGRSGLLAFTGAYHGQSCGSLAATANVAVKAPVRGVAADVTRLPYPHRYRCPFGLGGDLGDEVAAGYVRRLLDDPAGGVVAPAAMVVEPVQGEGGVVAAPDGWLRAMRAVTAERGIALVADEVQTGVGRTGAMWAVDHSGVVPDVLVASKAVGGGLPLALIVYREELDGWAPGAHTGTFRGNHLAFAAGAATLRVVREEGLVARAAELGGRLLADLRRLQAASPVVGDVRGRGLMVGLEIVDPDGDPDGCGARRPAPALARAIRRESLARGLIVELGGRDDCVVRLLPPLTIADAEVAAVVERLAGAVAAVGRCRA
ncbi:MAG: diaminobutyrate--2-oxoglutarate transaminase family protein [Acidimicrobiia bacterium]